MKSSEIIRVDSLAWLKTGSQSARDYIKKICTITARDINDNTFKLKLFKEEGDLIGIPRALVNMKKEIEPSDNWETAQFNFTKKLRGYQIPLVEKFINAYNEGQYGGILKAGTGTGKSIVALAIAARLGHKTCVIVPLSRIVEQWKNYILKFTDIKEDEIGYVWQDRIEFRNKKIVIAMLPSLAKRLTMYPKTFYNNFPLTIWDEGHVLGAKAFSQVVPLFHDKFRLMLSATPRRKDGAENVFKYHIGRVIAEYNKVLLNPTVLKVVFNSPRTSDRSYNYGGKFNRGRYLSMLGNVMERNRLIVRYVKKAYDKGRRIIVMSDRIQHLKVLEKLLELEGIKVSRFYDKYKDTKENVILATYGALGMAVDLPDRDTLILATPKSDIEQAAGRILREYPDKKNPVIVDIVDGASQNMLRGWKAREKLYRKIKANIKVKIINRGI